MKRLKCNFFFFFFFNDTATTEIYTLSLHDALPISRPIEVPFLIGAAGPKGIATAHDLADGVLGASPISGFKWSIALTFGTVLRDGEDAGSARGLAAAGPAAPGVFCFALGDWERRMVEAGLE